MNTTPSTQGRRPHASFWMDDNDWSYVSDRSINSTARLMRLRSIQRSVGNFIKIVTGKDIPVFFSGGTLSYTDGKHVVISANADPDKLDSIVGAALHESAHCLLSNASFAFLPMFVNHCYDWIVNSSSTNKELPIVTHYKRLYYSNGDFGKDHDRTRQLFNHIVMNNIKFTMNVLEDRRIDLWMYQNLAGYQPYYDALYAEYWHSPKIDRALKDPKFYDRSVESYIMCMVNMTNPNLQINAMPGLSTILKIANLTEVGLAARGDDDPNFRPWLSNQTVPALTAATRPPLLYKDAVDIMTTIFENATHVESTYTPEPDEDDGENESNGDLPNLDNPMEDLRREFERQLRFLEHDLDKDEIDMCDVHKLNTLNECNASLTNVKNDVLPSYKPQVLIFENVTPAIVREADSFPYGQAHINHDMKSALERGLRMGDILAHRLRIMQDERPLVFNRQQHGRIDKRRVAALGTSAVDVFQHTFVERKKPASVWLDIDFSGSMAGDAKAGNAIALAVCLAKAASVTRTLNVTIALRDGGELPQVAIIYDSRKHTMNHLQSIVPYLQVAGGTPESLCFDAIREKIMQRSGDERKYFINLSDGMPEYHMPDVTTTIGNRRNYNSVGFFCGDLAVNHCRKMMTEFRREGINVLSYFITEDQNARDSIHMFRKMYGPSAQAIDPTNIQQIANTLNHLFMDDSV